MIHAPDLFTAADIPNWWAAGGTAGFLGACGVIVRGLLQDNRKITNQALNVQERAAEMARPLVETAKATADARVADLERFHATILADRDRERHDLERRLAAMSESRDYWQAKALGQDPPPPNEEHHADG